MTLSHFTPERGCKIPGCGIKHYALGWCQKHHFHWRKGRDPSTYVPKSFNGGSHYIWENSDPQRFMREVAFAYDGDECLIWPYAKNAYGRAIIGSNGCGRFVSRVVCEKAYGPPPTPKHEAAHSCGNGAGGCVAKRHLRWATRTENEADKRLHGTAPIGAQNGRSKLSEGDIRAIISLAGEESRRVVAEKYSITVTHVAYIQTGKTWRHLDGSASQ